MPLKFFHYCYTVFEIISICYVLMLCNLFPTFFILTLDALLVDHVNHRTCWCVIMPPPLIGGGIEQWCCLTSVCLSDVCRVHHEYSWCPQLLEARRAGRRRRKACMSWSWAAAYRGRSISWGDCGPAHSLIIAELINRWVVEWCSYWSECYPATCITDSAPDARQTRLCFTDALTCNYF